MPSRRSFKFTSSTGSKTTLYLSLSLNIVLLIIIIARPTVNNCPNDNTGALLITELKEPVKSADIPEQVEVKEESSLSKDVSEVSNPQSTSSSVASEKDFLSIARKASTDKVAGNRWLQTCLDKPKECIRPGCVREKCRPWGHFYNTFYQRWLGPSSRDDVEPFQYLEIGYYSGRGFEAYMEFLPRGEGHSMEISCMEPGPLEEGKWPGENSAKLNKKWYQVLLDRKRLHCGDASDVKFLDKIWKGEMNRPNAPPLKLVIDDASHRAPHMVQTFFYWFPKIQPRGFLIIEDIQPLAEINRFRADFLPQIMSDLHYCGDPKFPEDAFFPTLWPLLASISCEMHICVFERNDEPANLDLPLDKLKPPDYALNYAKALQRTRKSQ